MALAHGLGSCTCQKSFASSLNKQLQNQTSVTLTKICTLKSYLILTGNSSPLEKSIICAAAGRIFKFLKITKIMDFFVKKNSNFYQKLNKSANFQKFENLSHRNAHYALLPAWQNFCPNPTLFNGTNLRQRNWYCYFEAVPQSSCGVLNGTCSWI